MLDSAMAETKKKSKYLTKTVKFGDKQFTLFSLDGVTWSSRRDELHMILERQEQERKSFNQIIGEQPAEKSADGEQKPTEEEEDPNLIEAEDDEILPITTEPARKPIKPRPSAMRNKERSANVEIKVSKKLQAPIAKPQAKKAGHGAPANVMAAPKARATSKPAKKAGKVKAKKRA